jgi:uncharacterized protein YjbI with pentapeptide repeats
MADEIHMRILIQGAEKLNQWRKNNPDIIPDLRHATLKHMDLSNYDFHFAYLNWVNFNGTNLRNCDFRCAHLEDAVLAEADISYADLREVNICDCNLSNTKQEGTLFTLCEQNLNTIYAESGDEDHD